MILFEEYQASPDLEIVADFGEHVLVVEATTHVFSFLSKNKKPIKSFSHYKSVKTAMNNTGVPIGVTAIAAYTQNKNLTAKLFAKNAYEKSFYKKIASDLQSTGKYKIRTLNVQGGTMFELKKVKT